MLFLFQKSFWMIWAIYNNATDLKCYISNIAFSQIITSKTIGKRTECNDHEYIKPAESRNLIILNFEVIEILKYGCTYK